MTESVRISGVRHPDYFENMADAELTKTGTKVWNILQSRQEYAGTVRLRQKDLSERLGLTESTVSRALDELKERGLVHPQGTKRGVILINPLFAAYESTAHMVNHLADPSTYIWPVTFPERTIRRRVSDPRTGTGFDPDPDGGEEASAPEEQRPNLRLAG
ncbi:replication/maintenance protein RepL [Streptomyces exfoliatus]|uniref:Replication/maintenance protein RepL n=1 Tax=Streptomyces exfoliatus TaxID=1905 RepID=A0ABV3D1M5_STREX